MSTEAEHEGNAYSVAELFACLFAREIKNHSVVGVPGVRSEVALAGVGLACRMHAPDVVFVNMSISFTRASLDPLRLSGFTMEYARMRNVPIIYEQDRFYDMIHKGVVDYMFGGGMQIDMRGNTNTVCIGDWENPTVRGPGGAGLSSVTFAHRYMLWLSEHTPRTLVEEVDFISSSGPYQRRQAGGYRTGGTPLLVTPLAVFDWNSETELLELCSIHEGVTLEEVRDATGFEIPDVDVESTRPPTPLELEILRRDVDPQGILRFEQPLG